MTQEYSFEELRACKVIFFEDLGDGYYRNKLSGKIFKQGSEA